MPKSRKAAAGTTRRQQLHLARSPRRTRAGSERQHGACGAAAQQPGERKGGKRNRKPRRHCHAAQLGGVPARDPIPHFSEQVILLRVRLIEHPDRAVLRQSRRRRQGRAGAVMVECALITFTQSPSAMPRRSPLVLLM